MRLRSIIALALGGLLSTQAVHAGDLTFDNDGGDNKWENNLNWQFDTTPGSGDIARVGAGTGTTVFETVLIDNTTGTANAGSLMIGVSSSTAGTVNMSGGILNVGSTLYVGGNLLNAGGNGTFIQSGGTVTAPQFLIGNSNTNATLASGYVAMSGGTLNVNNGTYSMGRHGAATVLLSGGTMNLSGSTGLLVTNGSTSFGGFTVDGGTLLGGTGSIEVSRNVGVGTFIVKSGLVNTGGTINLINNSGGLATLSVQGGSLLFGGLTTSNGGGATGFSTFLISGGTVAGGTITVSQSAASLNDSQKIYMSQPDPNVPTELSVRRIGQSNNIQDIRFDGGTLTIATVSFNTGPNNSHWQNIFNGGTLSPGNAGVAGGGSAFGDTNFATLNPVGTNFADFYQGTNHHLHLDIGDAGARDRLVFGNGTATLNGYIDVTYDGTTPTYGATYDVILAGAANGIIDNMLAGNLRLYGLADGWVIDKSIVTTTLTNDTLRLTLTPEPTMLGFAGVGAMMLLQRRARRSRIGRPSVGGPPALN